MARSTRGTVPVLAMGVAALALATSPASAGGSTLTFEQDSYRVGEVAYGVAPVGYAHNADLGAPEDGPFFLHLVSSSAVSESRPRPYVPDGAVRVGKVEFRKGPVQVPGTDHLTGPDHVVTEFTVPDLAPGTYATIVCNEPCRTSIGDVVFGLFVIEAGARSANAVPVTLAAGDGEGSARRTVLVGSGLLAAAGVAAIATRRRRSRRDLETELDAE